jgi:cytochrome d ubiquinol oxidase subunit II
MTLENLWFTLIAVLWCGYFLLEGFDFGVGVLMFRIGRTEAERGLLLRTIGPVWDGNEVWLIVAGGATFAAFPEWYATLFSGFYLALLLILVALIVRIVAIEYRNKETDPAWRVRWDWVHSIAAIVPALLWGVAFGNILRGVPIDAQHEFTGNFGTLLNVYSILGGLTTLSLFTLHGAVFLAAKTTGELRSRARRQGVWLGPIAVVLAVVFLTWTLVRLGSSANQFGASLAVAVVAAIALLGGLFATWKGRDGWAFVGTALAIVAATATLFIALHPDVMPSTTNPAYSLTIANASSSHYTLEVMSWVALIFTPLVLLYQGWTYWVFRARVTAPPSAQPGSRPGAQPSTA